MLKKSKDYWANKVEEEYRNAMNEQEREKALEINQQGWKKRLDESSWLLKGAQLVDENENDTEHKTILLTQKSHIESEDVHEKLNFSSIMLTKAKNLTNYLKIKPAPRLRPVYLVELEKHAKELHEKELLEKRDNDLLINAAKISMLYQAKKQLEKPKLPSHHTSIENFPDFELDLKPQLSLEERQKNLKNNEINKNDIIFQPPKIEQLKSVQEVIDEYNQENSFQIPGRYHYYMGKEKLYPLKLHPETIEVLLEEENKDNLPEKYILPDVNKLKEEKLVELRNKYNKEKKLYTIKPAQLHMSRHAIQFNESNSLIPSNENITRPLTTGHTNFYPDSKLIPTNLFGIVDNPYTVKQERPISRPFNYKEKTSNFGQDNSSISNSSNIKFHGNEDVVIINSKNKKNLEEDSISLVSSIHNQDILSYNGNENSNLRPSTTSHSLHSSTYYTSDYGTRPSFFYEDSLQQDRQISVKINSKKRLKFKFKSSTKIPSSFSDSSDISLGDFNNKIDFISKNRKKNLIKDRLIKNSKQF